MNLARAKSLLLHVKLLEWKRCPDIHDGASLRDRRDALRMEIRSGLRATARWRGSMNTGGFPNRRQRRHVAGGGSLYVEGFHWSWAQSSAGRSLP